MDQLWCIHIMEYYSAITRSELQIIYNMDESQMHLTKRKKPDSKGYTLYDSIYFRRSKIIGTENRSVVSRG